MTELARYNAKKKQLQNVVASYILKVNDITSILLQHQLLLIAS